MRFPPAFDHHEAAILSTIYELPNGSYDSYSLTWKINPTLEAGTPPGGVAFAETRNATERLIARGYVRGQRLSGADGVYFAKLRLAPRGERAAIQQRKQDEEFRKALPEADEVAREMIRAAKNSTSARKFATGDEPEKLSLEDLGIEGIDEGVKEMLGEPPSE